MTCSYNTVSFFPPLLNIYCSLPGSQISCECTTLQVRCSVDEIIGLNGKGEARAGSLPALFFFFPLFYYYVEAVPRHYFLRICVAPSVGFPSFLSVSLELAASSAACAAGVAVAAVAAAGIAAAAPSIPRTWISSPLKGDGMTFPSENFNGSFACARWMRRTGMYVRMYVCTEVLRINVHTMYVQWV